MINNQESKKMRKACIENPAGTTLKKEFEKGQWITKGHLARPYPFAYGFIPETLQEDGDPLDVFVVTKSLLKRGDIVDIEILGMIVYFESKKRDYKILARERGEKAHVTKKNKIKIKEFLLHAFDNTKRKVKLGKFYNADIAEEEIRRSMKIKRAKKKLIVPKSTPYY